MAHQIDRVAADGIDIFYRHAGPADGPVVLLLHGFPSSSFMYARVMPHLAAKGYRTIAPDLPGFGFTEVPAERNYAYTFANLTKTIEAFVDALSLKRFAVYIFDYGAPTGLRLALSRPGAVAAIVSQNGNAYAEGLARGFWGGLEALWQAADHPDTPAKLEQATAPLLTLDGTKMQYLSGAAHPERVPPETYTLDQALLDRPGNKAIQRALFLDYRTNVALYPRFQEYLRTSGVPVLAAWGKNDPIFIVPGAEAFARDVKKFELRLLDAGHFALEGNEAEVADAMHGFFEKFVVFKQ
jgi:pimeloyl-ACP methyl ester carboxylesterase